MHIALLLAAIPACAGPPASLYAVRRAQQLRAEGRFEEALHVTDREIGWGGSSPGPELVELHLALLRELGRTVEADAYDAFTRRYLAAEDTPSSERVSPRDCSDRQPGLRLIRSWARPEQGPWEIGPILATFEIDARGSPGCNHWWPARLQQRRNPRFAKRASAATVPAVCGPSKSTYRRLARIVA